jgi:hypothetical protein
MDSLSLKFAEESAIRQIEDCTDLAELKKLACTLVKAHFNAKALICQLMEQGLKDISRERCTCCPHE